MFEAQRGYNTWLCEIWPAPRITMHEIPRPVRGWHPSTPEVTAETLPGVLGEYDVVAVHFWAEWNGYDPLMDQSIRAVLPQFQEQVYFCSCNFDLSVNCELCASLRVTNIPFMACYVAGELAGRIYGFLSPECLSANLLELRPANRRGQ